MKKMETYPETCSIVRNELKFTIECSIEIYTYVDTEEKNIGGVWVHCDPVMREYKINNIIGFREQEKSDTYKNRIHTILDNTKMPTEWCMLVYHERGKDGIQVIPVVGTVKGLTKKYHEAYEEYSKKYRKISENADKLRKYFVSL